MAIDIFPETFQAVIVGALNNQPADTRVAVAEQLMVRMGQLADDCSATAVPKWETYWMNRGGLYAETIEALNAARGGA